MSTHVSKILGTSAVVHVDGVSDRAAAKFEQIVIEEIQRLEVVFNLFDPASDINQLRNQGRSDSPELNQVAKLAERWREKTVGAFNPAVDGLRTLWSAAEDRQKVPSAKALAEALTQIADEAGAPRHLNLNAIAKGWIVDRSIDKVMELGQPPQSCWVSIGGDVAHRGQGSITIGIEDPFRPFDNATPLTTIRLSNQALATSGGARRFWTIAGQRFSHVINPRSGLPVDHVASATVIAVDAATADVLATAATVLGISESLELIDATPQAACLLVASNQSVHHSARWPS